MATGPELPTSFDDALGILPPERSREIQRVRLERDKAWMNASKLPEASADLAALVEDIQKDDKADAKTLGEAPRGFGERPVLHDVAQEA